MATANNSSTASKNGGNQDRAILFLCIGLASIFWLFLKLSQSYSSGWKVALKYDMPQHQAFVKIPPDELEIVLNGEGWDLFRLKFLSRMPTLQIDSTYLKEASLSYGQVSAKLNTLLNNPNIQIQNISPDRIPLNVEARATKKIPVVLEHHIAFADNYQLKDSIFLTPDSITIAGPSSLINTVTSWPTKSLNLDQLNQPHTSQIALKKEEKSVYTFSQETVEVSVPVERFTEKQFFKTITVDNAVDSFKIFPNTVQLSVTVGLSKFDSVRGEDFELSVDMSKLDLLGKNTSLPINISKTSPYVKSVYINKKSVELFILKQDSVVLQQDSTAIGQDSDTME